MLATVKLQAQFTDPFSVEASLEKVSAEKLVMTLSFSIADDHYLYADEISLSSPQEKVEVNPVSLPKPKEKRDPFLEKLVSVYANDVVLQYEIENFDDEIFNLVLLYQGCSAELCFMPATKQYQLDPRNGRLLTAEQKDELDQQLSGADSAASWRTLAEDFSVRNRAAGYMPVDEFIRFIDRAESGDEVGENVLEATFMKHGVLLTILLILLGGLALNLTPCVLPMIPINIAIIGAGAQASTRKRGFFLGAAYGLGITLVYGILGVLAVLTGMRFGTLNSSYWFNIGIGLLFLVLALAMFGVFNLDFTKMMGHMTAGKSRKGSFATAFIFGGVAALLAGACVAPVVISVLLLSAKLYSQGVILAISLPFLLGLGMALPWPFAGAGLSFLPKPGPWMVRVKQAFGVLIMAFAFWYGWLGFQLLQARFEENNEAAQQEQMALSNEDWQTSLADGLAEAQRENKPVLIDFWATWCKNCLQMEKTTFKDDAVQERLSDYVKIKFNAEDLDDPAVRPVLDHFEVLGLPTYVILHPQRMSL